MHPSKIFKRKRVTEWDSLPCKKQLYIQKFLSPVSGTFMRNASVSDKSICMMATGIIFNTVDPARQHQTANDIAHLVDDSQSELYKRMRNDSVCHQILCMRVPVITANTVCPTRQQQIATDIAHQVEESQLELDQQIKLLRKYDSHHVTCTETRIKQLFPIW
jgi:hypothetical protein